MLHLLQELENKAERWKIGLQVGMSASSLEKAVLITINYPIWIQLQFNYKKSGLKKNAQKYFNWTLNHNFNYLLIRNNWSEKQIHFVLTNAFGFSLTGLQLKNLTQETGQVGLGFTFSNNSCMKINSLK